MVNRYMTKVLQSVENFLEAAIVLVAPNGRIKFSSEHASKLFELPADIETRIETFRDVVSYLAERGDFGPGDPEQFVDLFFQSLDNSHLSPFQSYLTVPSAQVLRVIIQKSKGGSITLTAIDISEQRRKENILKMALDIGLAGYMVYDSASESFTVESRYLEMLLTPDEAQSLEKQGPKDLIHKDDLARAVLMWRTAINKGEQRSGNYRVITEKQGTRWCRFVVTPESTKNNTKRYICFFSDITESVQQQENLNKAKQLAEKTLRSKEDFLARLSHEVRTPMNAVIGISDALIHHHADDKINPKLELIQNSATSILKMLDETLTHSRLDSDTFSLDPKPDSPGAVVRNICALWEQQALKNGDKIHCVIKDDVPSTMLFDKYRYEQCINNLLSNAVKFTHNGRINVVLTTIERRGSQPRLVLAIKDTGIGMTPEQQSKIFDAYTQADKTISSRFGGTGLGMNITKQIAERMGGTISVRSEIGKGATFALAVPITLPEEEGLTGAVETGEVQKTEALPISSQGENENTTPADVSNPAPMVSPATLPSSPALAQPSTAALAHPLHSETSAPNRDAAQLDAPPPDAHSNEDSLRTSATPALSNPRVTPSVLAAAEKSSQSVAIDKKKGNSRPILINETSTSLVDQMLVDAEPNTAYSHLKVLVVDDNSTNHLVIRSLLGSVVSEIHLASNGAEALETLDNTHVDVVLMDIHMPVMDGIECTLAIRSSEKSWKDVLIIALTADPQYQQKKLCLNIGMDEALAKPVRLNDLLGAIDTVLSKAEDEDGKAMSA